MSANLDMVRSIHAAWERRDYSSAEWAHPEIEYVFGDGPAPGSWKGVAGMAEGERDFLNALVPSPIVTEPVMLRSAWMRLR